MKKKGPWKVRSSRVVYKNPWISIREDKVIRPDGKDGIFGVVTMIPGVSVLPMDTDRNVYLAEEYRYGVERVTIEAISGGTDKGESKLDSARRELREEAGLIAKKWDYLGVVDPFTTAVVSPNHMYLARELATTKSSPEGTERIKIIKIPFIKAVDWVMKSKITHSATATLILKTKAFLKK